MLDAMRDAENGEMQCFDDEIEKMIRAGVIDMEVGLSYCTNMGNLRLCLADFVEAQANSPSRTRTLPRQGRPRRNLWRPSYAGTSLSGSRRGF